MNRPFTTIFLFAGLSLSGAAQAALHDRGGGLIYDDVLLPGLVMVGAVARRRKQSKLEG